MISPRHAFLILIIALLSFPAEGVAQSMCEVFVFDTDGSFMASVQEPRLAGCIVVLQGEGAAPLVAHLADPEHDPLAIDSDTVVRIISRDDVRSSMATAAVEISDRYGFFEGCHRLLEESGFGGNLDFSRNGMHDIIENVLYITNSWKEGVVAHNNYNYGNFLWGAAARELGVPLLVALLGSHFNNFFLSPDLGHFDSRDDQLSIRAGYHWRH